MVPSWIVRPTAASLVAARTNPSDPTQVASCIALEKATADGFSLVDWNTEDGVYNCDPANVVKLTGEYGKPATLADVGKTMDDVQ